MTDQTTPDASLGTDAEAILDRFNHRSDLNADETALHDLAGRLYAHNRVLVTEVRHQAERAEEYRAEVHRQRANLAELERLHTWDGLMSLLNEHWPEDIYPTREDDDGRDPGPRIVSLLRWVDRRETQLRNERERLNEALAENVRRLGEINGLRTKAKQAWSEGHAAALEATLNDRDAMAAKLDAVQAIPPEREAAEDIITN